MSIFSYVRPFQSARMKLSRASFHVASIRKVTDLYLAKMPLRAFHDPQNNNNNFVSFELSHEPPQIIPAIVGDALHNLRSALDVMMCDMVRLETNSFDVSGVYFPFAESAAEIDKMIKRRKVHLAGQPVVNLVKTLKSYKGGNLALRRIHDLDIADKHDSVIQIACEFRCQGKRVAGNTLNQLKPGWIGGSWVPDEATIARICGCQFTIEYLFDFLDDPIDGPGYINDPVLDTLQVLVEEVTRIVDSFETLCLGTITQFP